MSLYLLRSDHDSCPEEIIADEWFLEGNRLLVFRIKTQTKLAIPLKHVFHFEEIGEEDH